MQGHCGWPTVSLWVVVVALGVAVLMLVADGSPGVAVLPLWVVIFTLQAVSGVTMGGHSATQLPQQSHPSPATLPSTQVPPSHRGWGPHAAPLPPQPHHSQRDGSSPSPVSPSPWVSPASLATETKEI